MFLSNSSMFSVAFYYFGQVLDCNSNRERYAWLWVHAPWWLAWVTETWVRGCVVATRRKTTMLVLTSGRIVYFTQSYLMQLSIALSLHFGWDSQLNTSEMCWIDISRWMISRQMQMDFGLLDLAYRPSFWASSFICSIVIIGLHT